jgi:orotate phosphoribosyltransferase
MLMSDNSVRLILKSLIQEQALFKGKVILASGKESDYYLDLRKVTLSAGGSYYVGESLSYYLCKHKIVAVGGLTMGADPIVAATAARSYESGVFRYPLQAFIVRKQAKDHGRGRSIEGPDLPARAQVAIVDDVATSGGSLIQAIDRVQEETDWNIIKVLCIVDREEGAREAVQAKGFELEALFTAKELLE